MNSKSLLLLVMAAPLLSACPDSPTGITIVAGTWSYAVTEGIPLKGGGTAASCNATGAGTTQVSSGGAYAIVFPAVSCGSCTMSATTSGTVTAHSIGGTVAATISGSGCTNGQPAPSTISGACKSDGCTGVNPTDDSYAVEFTLTPPD